MENKIIMGIFNFSFTAVNNYPNETSYLECYIVHLLSVFFFFFFISLILFLFCCIFKCLFTTCIWLSQNNWDKTVSLCFRYY